MILQCGHPGLLNVHKTFLQGKPLLRTLYANKKEMDKALNIT